SRGLEVEGQSGAAIGTVAEFGKRGRLEAAAPVRVYMHPGRRAPEHAEHGRGRAVLHRAAVVGIARGDVAIGGTKAHLAVPDASHQAPVTGDAPRRLGVLVEVEDT